VIESAKFDAAVADKSRRVGLPGEPEEEIACGLTASRLPAGSLVERVQRFFGDGERRSRQQMFKLCESSIGLALDVLVHRFD